MNYLITKEQKDQISNYLKSVTVPALIGANLIHIATLLDNLEAIKEEEPKKK